MNENFPYEIWNLELSATPTRSRLCHLEPAQLGATFVESLTSYICRLASKHDVSTRSLVTQEVFPLLGKSYLSLGWKSNNITSFWKDSSSLNGANESSKLWVEVLGKLTQRNDLRFATMLPWAGVLSSKDLVRNIRAWCPFCYQKWKQDNRVVYDALLWSLEVVKICPLHQVPLQQQCPYTDCKRDAYILAPRTVPGYCPHCGRWLGMRSAEGPLDSAATLDGEEMRWQHWVVTEVGKLQAASPYLGVTPRKEFFSEAVEKYLHEMAGGNVSATARKFLVDRKTIRCWKNGMQVPQLTSLLQFCYLCEISPLSIFTDCIKIGASAEVAVAAMFSKNKKYYRDFDKERVRRSLETELTAGSYPPLPMSKVARKLGYDHSFLCKYYPTLCRVISERFEAYRAIQCEENKQGVICEIRQIALQVHSEGFYPSQVRVRNKLTKPWTIRIPEAHNAWHAVLKDLGCGK